MDNSTAVPTLRVMRLQSPELHLAASGNLADRCALHTSLCLPDSLGVYVGETFSAYLGILNASKTQPIRKLTVSAQLQTPSARWQLPAPRLDSNPEIPPNGGVDAIVSHDVEEAGQHILRVEVGYVTLEGASKTFRKFYRFNVVAPLTFRTVAARWGDSTCLVSVAVEHASASASTPTPAASPQPSVGSAVTETLVVATVDFVPADGLAVEPLSITPPSDAPVTRSAVQLFDQARVLAPGSSVRHLFRVTAHSRDAILRGIAAGDLLGRAVVTWRKAMGETGRVSSAPLHCPAVVVPPIAPLDDGEGAGSPPFVVHKSGLSVDVAAAAAASQARGGPPDASDWSVRLPVTVEAIDPPARLKLHVARPVQFLVVNHAPQPRTLQVQFSLGGVVKSGGANHLADGGSAGVAVCGRSVQTLDHVPPNGGSAVVTATLLPLAAGLLTMGGCAVVDLLSGQEIPQPPLFRVLVEE